MEICLYAVGKLTISKPFKYQTQYVGKGDYGTGNKSQALTRLMGSGFKIEFAKIENMQAMEFGDTDVVHDLNTGKAITGGKTYSNPLRRTDVIEKRDGR